MATAGTPPPPAGKGKRQLTREQKIMLGTAGGGGLVALLVLARRGSKGGADASSADTGLATAGQPYVQPAQYSDAGISAYNNLQSEIEALTGRLDELGSVGQQTPTPVTPPAGPGTARPHYLPGQTAKVGQLGGTYSLRSIAAQSVLPGSSPTSVEAALRRIVAANPSLRGRTSVGGGTVIHFPGG